MTACELFESADIEMYFYAELDRVDRARVVRHMRGCEACQQRLEDLHAIRRALEARPAVDGPPAGDWSGFTGRLDRALAGTAEASNLRAAGQSHPGPAERWNLAAVISLAAMLALVAIGVLIAARFRPTPLAGGPAGTAAETRAAVNTPPVGNAVERAPANPDRALREGSAEHLERSKLVVLGLATRDPRARAEDWQYERTLAGTLLTDTRLYRQAATQGGVSDVERVMRDLETVLLEASLSDTGDRAALERVQRLIAKRDLVVKMQGAATAGPAGN